MENKRGTKKYTYDEVKDYIEGYGFTLLSNKYEDNKKKLLIKCPEGHEFERSFSKFKFRTHLCPQCSKKNRKSGKRKLTYTEVREYIESQGYKLLSEEYINCRSKLLVECPEGHKYDTTWSNFRKGARCKICRQKENSDRQKLSYKEVKEYIESQGYKLLSDKYVNNREKLLIKCPEGHEFYARFDLFKVGNRCPHCNYKSKGQEEIKNILDKHNVNFNIEQRFNDCKFKYTLPFDFYLPDYNCCVEFDGIQHYEIVDYFGGFDRFVESKIRDTIKNIYCEENNIDLIRIPYWEFDNMEDILMNELSNRKIEAS